MYRVPPEKAEQPLVLSLDIGTTSVRALLFDRLGRELQGVGARQESRIRTTPRGASGNIPANNSIRPASGGSARAGRAAGQLVASKTASSPRQAGHTRSSTTGCLIDGPPF